MIANKHKYLSVLTTLGQQARIQSLLACHSKRNDVMVRVGRDAGKDVVRPSPDAMRCHQILPRRDWERVCLDKMKFLSFEIIITLSKSWLHN